MTEPVKATDADIAGWNAAFETYKNAQFQPHVVRMLIARVEADAPFVRLGKAMVAEKLAYPKHERDFAALEPFAMARRATREALNAAMVSLVADHGGYDARERDDRDTFGGPE